MIPSGNILVRVFLYGNMIVTIRMTDSEIKEALGYSESMCVATGDRCSGGKQETRGMGRKK